MPLPVDFDITLERVQKLGIPEEDPGQIRDHLALAVREAAETNPDLSRGDLGFIDWSTKILRKCEVAIHQEICDPSGAGLKDHYKGLLDKAAGDEQVKQIATAITSIIATVNPAIAVSSVVVYFALWLAKVGLNYWCKESNDPS